MAETMVELSIKLENWKSGMEAKGLRVNTKKTKVMISHPDAGPVYKSGKYPCGVCSKGVGRNSIQCTSCKQWVHARCSGIRGNLSKVKDFVCSSCTQQIKECEPEKVTIGNSSYVVSQFCYLGDMLSAGGGSEASSITRTWCA